MEPSKGQLLSLSDVAAQLGMSAQQLRSMCRKGQLPAEKHAGRWLVQASDVPKVSPLRRLAPLRARGRVAEGAALDDMTHQLLHRGTVVSRRARRGRQSAAGLAASDAIDNQLDGGQPAPPSLPMPAGLAGKARKAQRKALEHMQDRRNRPHPPERSL
jgi:hypothetical protein